MYNHILIHAPRGGSDPIFKGLAAPHEDFNPRSPWGERHVIGGTTQPSNPFQSTLPVGGATTACHGSCDRYKISIHAPRGGSDQQMQLSNFPCQLFQSTLPVGGATVPAKKTKPTPPISIHAPRGGSDRDFTKVREFGIIISIHAPRGGSDCQHHKGIDNFDDFNPRSPWGERHITGNIVTSLPYFNPRSPWGERQSHNHAL